MGSVWIEAASRFSAAEKKTDRRRRAARACLLPAALLAASCYPSRPRLAAPPAEVETIEGHASLRLTRGGAASRSKFSFLLRLPDQGRIEVLDPLRRTVSLLLFTPTEAYFVLPGKRAYWKAGREEVLEKLLGFDLTTAELAGMLTGRWSELLSWDLERDGRGRVFRGRRAELRFEVRTFFASGSLPELLVFSRGEDQGSLKILRLDFNRPLKEDALRPAFLEDPGFRQTAWEEMEKWLRERAGG